MRDPGTRGPRSGRPSLVTIAGPGPNTSPGGMPASVAIGIRRATDDVRVGGEFTPRMEAKDGGAGFGFRRRLCRRGQPGAENARLCRGRRPGRRRGLRPPARPRNVENLLTLRPENLLEAQQCSSDAAGHPRPHLRLPWPRSCERSKRPGRALLLPTGAGFCRPSPSSVPPCCQITAILSYSTTAESRDRVVMPDPRGIGRRGVL